MKRYSKFEHSLSNDVILEKVEKKETRDTKKILIEDYGYLLNMNIWSLTDEKVKNLEKQLLKDKEDLDYMINTKPEILWKNDLNDLKKEI